MLSRIGRRASDLFFEARQSAAFAATESDPFPAGAHPTDYRRSGLGRFAKKVAASVAEAVLSDEDAAGTLIPGEAEVVTRIVNKLDLWLGSGSSELSNGFKVLCLAMEGSPALILRKFGTFSGLPLRDRLELLERLEEHENGLFSMLLTAFKVPLVTAAYEEGPLLRETGFDRVTLSTRRNRDGQR